MSTFIEKYEAAKRAVHPDKFVVAGGIALLSIPILVPLQSYLTYLIHESGEQLSTEWLQILAVAIIGLANTISIAVETKALEEKQYSASPMSTTLKVFIKNSLGIATAGHAINFAQIYLVNPVHLINFYSLQVGGGSRLFFENAIGVTLALSAWKLFFNTGIIYLNNEVLKGPAKKISDRFRTNEDARAMHDIDLLQ